MLSLEQTLYQGESQAFASNNAQYHTIESYSMPGPAPGFVGGSIPKVSTAYTGYSPCLPTVNIPALPAVTEKPKSLAIYDIPSVQAQVHLHSNEQGISGGRLYSYDRKSYRLLNAQEGAMLDYAAKNLGMEDKKD